MKKTIKDYSRLLLAFFAMVLIAKALFLYEDNKVLETVLASETTTIETKNETVVVKEKIVPYVITEKLPKDYNHKKEMIMMYLRSKGVSEDDLVTWDRIISTESKYDQNSEAPTYWKVCSDNRIIELRQYENGTWWQAYCEDFGLTTLREGKSRGLLHILDITWEGHKCEGKSSNWMAELNCGLKIKEQSGFTQWASY